MASVFNATVHVLSAALQERDNYTRHHCDRVAAFSDSLAQHLGVSEEEREALRMAAQFHDIGKIGIPDQVLLKPGPLTPEERHVIETHAEIGERIFRATEHPQISRVAPLIRHHHEAFNGTGYPDRLAGETIPALARVLAVADAYDALTTVRPYRTALPLSKVLDILGAERGLRYDPVVVDALTRIVN